jgi:hypothetical protein
MGNRKVWQGTAGELLSELENHHADEKTKKRKEWPTSPRKLSGELRRLAPNLRREKLSVTFGERTRKGTPITLEWVGKEPSPPTPPAPTQENTGFAGDGRSRNGDGRASQPSPENPARVSPGDGGEGGDGVFPDCSADLGSEEEVVEWTA